MANWSETQAAFYRSFLMARKVFEPRDYGVDMERDNFIDILCDAFADTYRGQWSLDELLLHPREALVFCDQIKRRLGAYDLPDDIILRAIMNRRK